jgi:hypothetical protein
MFPQLKNNLKAIISESIRSLPKSKEIITHDLNNDLKTIVDLEGFNEYFRNSRDILPYKELKYLYNKKTLELNIKPDEDTFNTMLYVYIKYEKYEKLSKFAKSSIKKGIQIPNVKTYNIFLKHFSGTDTFEHIYSDLLDSEDFYPSLVTFFLAIKHYTELKNVEMVKKVIFSDMKKFGKSPDAKIYSYLLKSKVFDFSDLFFQIQKIDIIFLQELIDHCFLHNKYEYVNLIMENIREQGNLFLTPRF